MIESPRLKNKNEKISLIKNFLEEMQPSEVNFIQYKHNRLEGVAWHDDGYSMFGTIIIILKDSDVGRLRIESTDIPENLQPRDVMVIDPTCIHQVERALRLSDRQTSAVVL